MTPITIPPRNTDKQYYILGVDQSFTSTGLCVIDINGTIVDMDVFVTSPHDGDVFTRSIKIARVIIDWITKYDPVMVGIEGLAFRKFGNSTRDLASLQSAIVTVIRTQLPTYHNARTVIIAPTSIKKFATGVGSAKKVTMWEAVPESVKPRFKDYKKSNGREDLVDAYWIAYYTLCKKVPDNIEHFLRRTKINPK